MSSKLTTITCFLCGGTHIYPGPRFEAHLINEHGALFHTDFLIEVSQFKGKHAVLPDIGEKQVESKEDPKVCTTDVGVQTEQTEPAPLNKAPELSSKPFPGITIKTEPDIELNTLDIEEDMSMSTIQLNDTQEEFEDSGESLYESENTERKIPVWFCPICPLLFKKVSLIKQHMCIAHEVQSDEYDPVQSVEMSEEEYENNIQMMQKRTKIKKEIMKNESTPVAPLQTNSSETRKVVGTEWEPNSFSSRFTCYFCGEQFRKDYKLKLHLMMKHKNQPDHLMVLAKEELIKAKLDGCVHKCGLCGNKYNSIANFTRHIKDVHNISRMQYKKDYGESEILSRMFACELCQKQVKHTRNIIGAHMKMVHLISWKEYQDIILKLKNGEESVDLPNPELFDCHICGVSVKYKKEHLNKKHQIDEEVYEELIDKKSRGEDISQHLPDREVFTCQICERECMDLRRHLQVCHKLTEEVYKEEFLMGLAPQRKIFKQELCETPDPKAPQEEVQSKGQLALKKPLKTAKESQLINKVPKQKLDEVLSTDLQCYFNCQEVFKKDYQLFLHLKLRHRTEGTSELEKAYAAANEEIALTRRSASLFNCALCPRVFNDNGAFYGHIQNKHDILYRDYKEKYGRCETESQPFECSICAKVIKYDRNTVHTHLKHVHGINWTKYLDRIRKIRRGVAPDPLPQLKTVECRVCNVSVKYLRDHLRNAHQITEQEYEDLFLDDSKYKGSRRDKKGDNTSLSSSNNSEFGEGYSESVPLQMDLTTHRPTRLEIQNKDNKSCSVCEFEFSSRKEFIEHCQLVHEMKFKTKSGLSIPTPNPQKRPAPRDPDEEDEEGPESKRCRSFQTSDGYEIEIEGAPCQQDVSISNSGFGYSTLLSKWNLCVFQCGICRKTSNSKKGLMGHIMSNHGLGSKAYKASYPDLEISIEWFHCRICNTRVKFMKDLIASHLKGHATDLTAYERQYMREEDWPHHPDHQSIAGVVRRVSSNSTESREEEEEEKEEEKKVGSGSLPLKEEAPNKSGSKSSDPWNKCEFQCTLCDKIYSDRRTIRSHIQSSHRIDYKDYVAQYGDPELKTPKWVCKICGGETRHSRNNIYTHLRESHSMSVDQYATEYGNQVKPNEPTKGTWVKKSAKNKEKWNKCIFKCPLCDKEANDKKIIRQHTGQDHNVSLEDLEIKHGSCEYKTKYFLCKICNSEVKHIYKNIMMHLQRSHELTPASYENIYGDGPSMKRTPQEQQEAKRTPTDKGAFPCAQCGKRFSSKSNRARHVRDKCQQVEDESPKEEESPRCPVSGCGERFERSLQLKRHLTRTHKIDHNISVKLRETDRQAAEGMRIIKEEPGSNDKSSEDDTAAVYSLDQIESDAEEKPNTPSLHQDEDEDERDRNGLQSDHGGAEVKKEQLGEKEKSSQSISAVLSGDVEQAEIGLGEEDPKPSNKQEKVGEEAPKPSSKQEKNGDDEKAVPDSTTGENIEEDFQWEGESSESNGTNSSEKVQVKNLEDKASENIEEHEEKSA